MLLKGGFVFRGSAKLKIINSEHVILPRVISLFFPNSMLIHVLSVTKVVEITVDTAGAIEI